MKTSPIFSLTLSSALLLFCITMNAQQLTSEHTKRVDDYLELLQQGYSEIEIFQDLGNVNFLTENYESAAFWYEKLFKAARRESLGSAIKERYAFAMAMATGVAPPSEKQQQWVASIAAEYQKNQSALALTMAPPSLPKGMEEQFTPDVALSADGTVAYFSQAIQRKPDTGIFSKKETVYEIYSAERIGNAWRNIKKLDVCPKYASAKHPTLSKDGKRLFFASNMRGSYGDYDIYVSDILPDGTVGVAKNLGPKVNTRKDDLYPNLTDNSVLVFASSGREGYGGLDLYAAEIKDDKVGKAFNLGNKINSKHDEYALSFVPEKKMGYVMSNRENAQKPTQIAFTYSITTDYKTVEKDESKLLKVLNDSNETDYSATVFEH
ncbi:OmpA family protein [Croceitalea dokdonensis DOKDO 023]|uniref:OmpA family protein n=1 Tax=Croceitalea dokdonensis DOKDO 023 TaxID=1300341 RepID=A0A0P7B4G4_9FLAO|nr:PD40 domain-containing protein [Croceitalea dokdonensis]KPM33613.1 OmpA family protein [Croceitalea dokdonensis DOKDO 023]